VRQWRGLVLVTAAITLCVTYGALAESPSASTLSSVVAVSSTAPPASADTAAPSTTTVFEPRTFTLVASGDLLSHTSVLDQARHDDGGDGYQYGEMLGAVRPTIEGADLAICHLETPFAAPGTEIDGVVPVFGAPPELAAEMVEVGYDRCSLASNHALDQGAAGVDATLGAFDAAGLGHAGMARSAEEAAPRPFDVNGVPVAHLSASYSFNGFTPPAGEPWRANLIDPARIIAEAQQARAAGAAVVIVSLHWGHEGVREVLPEQRQVAEQLTASGAIDLIIGHHAHVVQPIEQVNGRWVVFGMGNQLSGMGDSTDCCGIRALDGLMVRAEFVEQRDGTFTVAQPEAIPSYLGRHPYRVVPVTAALADPAVAGHITTDELQASLDRTSEVVAPFIRF
jgi:poly-gamma-glutamate synthesis protein (capsule biosynthesis protein)